MTRARDRLHLSWADSYEGTRSWRRSRFLDEVQAAGGRHFKVPRRARWGALGWRVSDELRAATGEDQIDPGPESKLRLSFSGISTYRECPRQYQYRYVHRLPVPATAEAQWRQ